MPSQPCSASFRQNSSVTAAGSAIRWRTNCVVHSLSRNRRAVSRSSSCSSVNPMSMFQSRRVLPLTLTLSPLPRGEGTNLSLAPLAGRGVGVRGHLQLPFWQAEDALADDVALDLAGAAGDRVLPCT